MKRLWLLLVMLFLAACGGGGGDSAGNGTGVLSVNFVDGSRTAKTAALAPDPDPEWVRVVVRQGGTNFKQVTDVQLGSSPPSMNIPSGDHYKVEAIYYTKVNGLNRILYYGSFNGTAGSGTSVVAGGNVAVTLTMNKITTPNITAPSTLSFGNPYNVDASFGQISSLQTPWSLTRTTSAITTTPHLSTNPPRGTYTTLLPPDAPKLYLMGEFFISENLIKSGESTTSWNVYSPVAELPITGSPVGISGGVAGFASYSSSSSIFTDIWPPSVSSFVIPQQLQPYVGATNAAVIAATDNVQVKKIKITNSRTRPTNSPTTGNSLATSDAGWSDPGALPLPDPSFTPDYSPRRQLYYAWAKDARGNVSFANVSTAVIFDKTPQIKSFGQYSSGIIQSPKFRVSLTGESYVAAPPVTSPASFCISTTKTGCDGATFTPWSGTAILREITTPAVSTNLTQQTLYAWVKDSGTPDSGISTMSQFTYTFTSRPLIKSFVTPTSVQTSALVSGMNFTASAYAGRTITKYLLTTSNIAPTTSTIGWTDIASPTNQVTMGVSYNFGTLPTGSNKIYLYVMDNTTAISSMSGGYLRF